MTTKFSPGDRVRVYDRCMLACPANGTVAELGIGKGADGVRVELDKTPPHVKHKGYWVHSKQLRRLRKKTSVVWESECRVGIGEGNSGVLRNVDDSSLSNVALSKFIGKRVRIVITEAKPQEKEKQ